MSHSLRPLGSFLGDCTLVAVQVLLRLAARSQTKPQKLAEKMMVYALRTVVSAIGA